MKLCRALGCQEPSPKGRKYHSPACRERERKRIAEERDADAKHLLAENVGRTGISETAAQMTGRLGLKGHRSMLLEKLVKEGKAHKVGPRYFPPSWLEQTK